MKFQTPYIKKQIEENTKIIKEKRFKRDDDSIIESAKRKYVIARFQRRHQKYLIFRAIKIATITD